MVRRLVELYQPSAQVQIKLTDGQWWPGRVVEHDPPGIWVLTVNRGLWFVTNGRRIRPLVDDMSDEEES